MPVRLATLITLIFYLALAGCGDEATLPVDAGTGPNPELPPPVQTLLPTVVLAHAKGWPEGAKPMNRKGFRAPLQRACLGSEGMRADEIFSRRT